MDVQHLEYENKGKPRFHILTECRIKHFHRKDYFSDCKVSLQTQDGVGVSLDVLEAAIAKVKAYREILKT